MWIVTDRRWIVEGAGTRENAVPYSVVRHILVCCFTPYVSHLSELLWKTFLMKHLLVNVSLRYLYCSWNALSYWTLDLCPLVCIINYWKCPAILPFADEKITFLSLTLKLINLVFISSKWFCSTNNINNKLAFLFNVHMPSEIWKVNLE